MYISTDDENSLTQFFTKLHKQLTILFLKDTKNTGLNDCFVTLQLACLQSNDSRNPFQRELAICAKHICQPHNHKLASAGSKCSNSFSIMLIVFYGRLANALQCPSSGQSSTTGHNRVKGHFQFSWVATCQCLSCLMCSTPKDYYPN